MPYKPLGPCMTPGCKGRATRRGKCELHAQQAAAAYRKSNPDTRPSAAERGYTTAWDKLRGAYIKQHPDCGKCGAFGPKGMIVDHVMPKDQGGPDEWANLQTLCRSCHGIKTAGDKRGQAAPVWRSEEQRLAGFGHSRIPVTIVAGPPGSGKTSYVEKHRQWGDLVVDVDLLYQALTGGLPWYEKPDTLLPFVAEARDAVIARLSRASKVRRAWIVTGKEDMGELRALKDVLGAEQVVVLEVSPTECLRRICNDERRGDKWELWEPLVRKWWTTYQASKAREEYAPVVA